MAATLVTIRIRLSRPLLARIEAAAAQLDASPAGFMQYASENELARQEAARLEEQAALEQLRESVLASGQSLSIHPDAEPAGEAACQLCLREIPHATRVEGPLLCDACYALAQGDRAPARRTP
jgi:hypothetical protein